MPFAKCNCTSCSGHIEFEADNAGRTIPCPHCGLDTILYLAPTTPQKPEELNFATKRQGQSSTLPVEKLIFGLVRVFTLILSVIAVISLVLLGVGFFSTLKAENRQAHVTYEAVSTSLLPSTSPSARNPVATPRAETSSGIPKNVQAAFSGDEQTLFTWLDEMDKAREEKFLKNLSEIVSKAESAGVGRSKMKGVIQRFKELWDASRLLKNAEIF